MSGDDFYIGWEGHAAPELARFTRAKVLALLAVGFVVAALVAATQPPFAGSRFEFGGVRWLARWLRPAPARRRRARGRCGARSATRSATSA